jgi:hypothetical protein
MYNVSCRAEQILENSGVSIAPPARVFNPAISFAPSKATQVLSTRIRQDKAEESSEESSMSCCSFL